MDAIAKWKRAVVHLECAADSQSLNEFIEKFRRGEITRNELIERLQTRTRDLRYQGTAIFLEHEGHQYLITARHVVHDEVSAKRNLEEEIQRLPTPSPIYLELTRERATNQVFNIIFRVPSLDEVLSGGKGIPPKFLMNLGAGVPSSFPYTFSNPKLDLAIISLDRRYSEFADELLSSGYVPMSMSDIVDEPSAEGVEVFTVGYPPATAVVAELDLPSDLKQWSSSFVSIPTFAFGRVSMLHRDLPFFWCDMSIYPGNSGGPVVENGKLVGIVSEQPIIPSEIVGEADGKRLPWVSRARIPFGKIIKAKFIQDLLEAQIHKNTARAPNPHWS